MVTTHSGQLSWLISIRYWKKVVMDTGISASPYKIKNKKFYKNISSGWKKTESTKNKWTESVATVLRNIPFGL